MVVARKSVAHRVKREIGRVIRERHARQLRSGRGEVLPRDAIQARLQSLTELVRPYDKSVGLIPYVPNEYVSRLSDLADDEFLVPTYPQPSDAVASAVGGFSTVGALYVADYRSGLSVMLPLLVMGGVFAAKAAVRHIVTRVSRHALHHQPENLAQLIVEADAKQLPLAIRYVRDIVEEYPDVKERFVEYLRSLSWNDHDMNLFFILFSDYLSAEDLVEMELLQDNISDVCVDSFKALYKKLDKDSPLDSPLVAYFDKRVQVVKQILIDAGLYELNFVDEVVVDGLEQLGFDQSDFLKAVGLLKFLDLNDDSEVLVARDVIQVLVRTMASLPLEVAKDYFWAMRRSGLADDTVRFILVQYGLQHIDLVMQHAEIPLSKQQRLNRIFTYCYDSMRELAHDLDHPLTRQISDFLCSTAFDVFDQCVRLDILPSHKETTGLEPVLTFLGKMSIAYSANLYKSHSREVMSAYLRAAVDVILTSDEADAFEIVTIVMDQLYAECAKANHAVSSQRYAREDLSDLYLLDLARYSALNWTAADEFVTEAFLLLNLLRDPREAELRAFYDMIPEEVRPQFLRRFKERVGVDLIASKVVRALVDWRFHKPKTFPAELGPIVDQLYIQDVLIKLVRLYEDSPELEVNTLILSAVYDVQHADAIIHQVAKNLVEEGHVEYKVLQDALMIAGRYLELEEYEG